MALLVNREYLNKLDVIPYITDARPQIKTGDLFFCSGDYFFSKAIRYFSKSAWSHVGIIYKEENIDRVLFLESELVYGVRMAPLSKYIRDNNGKRKPYKGVVVIASVHLEEKERLAECIRFGMDELTRPYDNWEIFRILLRMMFRKGKSTRDRKYVCSEYVEACFNKAGITFPYIDDIITPECIWQDERVKLRFRVL